MRNQSPFSAHGESVSGWSKQKTEKSKGDREVKESQRKTQGSKMGEANMVKASERTELAGIA